jgi:hypothetical protein
VVSSEVIVLVDSLYMVHLRAIGLLYVASRRGGSSIPSSGLVVDGVCSCGPGRLVWRLSKGCGDYGQCWCVVVSR